MNFISRLLCFSLTLLILITSVDCALAREWSDTTGKYKAEAELVKIQGDNVHLKLTDGRVIQVPLARLSDADRQYLSSLNSATGGDLLKFVPSDMPMVVSVRPRRLLNDEAVQGSPVVELMERVGLAGTGSPVIMLRRIGQSLDQVEELVVILSALPDPKLRRNFGEKESAEEPPTFEQMQASQRGYSPTYAMMIRFTTPLDRQRVQATLFRPQAMEIAGFSGFGPSKEPSLEPLALFLDERTLLVGDAATARRMAAAASASADETLASQFDTAWDLQVRVNVNAVRELAPPGADDSMKKLVSAAEVVTLAAKLGDLPTIEVVAGTKSEDDAQQFSQGLLAFQQLGSQLVAQQLAQPDDPNAEADPQRIMLEQAKQLLDEIKIETDMKQVKIRYAGSLGVEQLMATLKDRPLPGAAGSDQEVIGKVYDTMIKPLANADAEEIRYQAGSAAGLSVLDLFRISMSTKTPTADMISDQPLTLTLMLLEVPKADEEADKEEEFKFSSDFIPRPVELAAFLSGGSLGYGTLIPYEFITDVTVEKQGDTATGVISFTNPSFLIGYSGKVNYATRQQDGQWEIIKFAFPVRGWAFNRQADGTWKAEGLKAISESDNQ